MSSEASRPVAGSRPLALAAAIALVTLIFWLTAWELVVAPLAPGGSWLVLKVLPLCAALPGVLKRRLYTFQWTSMLILLYVAEAAVRAMSDPDALSRLMAWGEGALAIGVFAAVVLYVRPFKRALREARLHA
ncbi:DUF2069 domain-containing protein [soil metagenome]